MRISLRELLSDAAALETALAPRSTPSARWPGPERRALHSAQQAVVNVAVSRLEARQVLAADAGADTRAAPVARDVVAAVVAARAEAMLEFDDPAQAFARSSGANGAAQTFVLDERLRGFELVAIVPTNQAASTFGAVLGARDAIAADAGHLRYFAATAAKLHDHGAWGLMSVPLGTAADGDRAVRSLWQDADVGLQTYLRAASTGRATGVADIDPNTGASTVRMPRVVADERVPPNRDEALQRWQRARAIYRFMLARSRKGLDRLERIRTTALQLSELSDAEDTAVVTLSQVRARRARTGKGLEGARVAMQRAEKAIKGAEARIAEHNQTRPRLVARVLNTQAARFWRSARDVHVRTLEEWQEAHAAAATDAEKVSEPHIRAALEAKRLEREAAETAARRAAAQRVIEIARNQLGTTIVDDRFIKLLGYEDRQSSPWLNAPAQRARDDLFVAAMFLHKAFIDAAAAPLLANVSALAQARFGFADDEAALVNAHLWSSFALLVPVITTTPDGFARLFDSKQAPDGGWLITQACKLSQATSTLGARRVVELAE
jgi:hypothetical protein